MKHRYKSGSQKQISPVFSNVMLVPIKIMAMELLRINRGGEKKRKQGRQGKRKKGKL